MADNKAENEKNKSGITVALEDFNSVAKTFHGSTRNFNALMPMAADIVIVEAEHITEEPLSPDNIIVPGIFVDYLVNGGSAGTD